METTWSSAREFSQSNWRVFWRFSLIHTRESRESSGDFQSIFISLSISEIYLEALLLLTKNHLEFTCRQLLKRNGGFIIIYNVISNKNIQTGIKHKTTPVFVFSLHYCHFSVFPFGFSHTNTRSSFVLVMTSYLNILLLLFIPFYKSKRASANSLTRYFSAQY